MTPGERLQAVLARRRALWPSLAAETPCPADGEPCLPWCRQRATCPPRTTPEENLR